MKTTFVSTARRWRARRVTVPVLLVGLLVLAACGGGAEGPDASASADSTAMPDEIRIYSCCVSGTEIPVWVAYDEGLFEENGLNAAELQMLPPPTGIQALTSDSVDIGNDSPGGVLAAAAAGNENVKLVAGKTSKPVYYIMTNDLTDPKDLRGKRLGVSNKYAAPAVAAYTYLENELGLTVDEDYEVVPFAKISDLVPALAQDTIDAAVLSAPLNFASEAQGAHTLADLTATVSEGNSWVTVNTRFAEKYPAAVTAYIKTIAQAMALAKSEPDVAIAAIMNHQKVSREVAQQTYDAYIDVFDPYMYEEALQPYLNYASTPEIAAVDPSTVMDTSFLDQLEASGELSGFERQG
jgi:NitT/TauT family transport system substrate-binding protein